MTNWPAPKTRWKFTGFSEQPQGYVSDAQLEQFDSGRLGFPNTFFDPDKAHILYNEYHDQYALADEVGFDGIMTNEPPRRLLVRKARGEPGRRRHRQGNQAGQDRHSGQRHCSQRPSSAMAEEIAMLDCYSGGRIISGFVRGGAVETLQAGIDPTENRERFEEAHDLIVKCWTEPGPLPLRGKVLPVSGGQPLGVAQ